MKDRVTILMSPVVCTAVSICRSPQSVRELRENVAAVQKGPLDSDEMEFMRDFDDAVYKQQKWFM